LRGTEGRVTGRASPSRGADPSAPERILDTDSVVVPAVVEVLAVERGAAGRPRGRDDRRVESVVVPELDARVEDAKVRADSVEERPE
jgi:hypothetical protein